MSLLSGPESKKSPGGADLRLLGGAIMLLCFPGCFVAVSRDQGPSTPALIIVGLAFLIGTILYFTGRIIDAIGR
jgi:hypothetical protein